MPGAPEGGEEVVALKVVRSSDGIRKVLALTIAHSLLLSGGLVVLVAAAGSAASAVPDPAPDATTRIMLWMKDGSLADPAILLDNPPQTDPAEPIEGVCASASVPVADSLLVLPGAAAQVLGGALASLRDGMLCVSYAVEGMDFELRGDIAVMTLHAADGTAETVLLPLPFARETPGLPEAAPSDDLDNDGEKNLPEILACHDTVQQVMFAAFDKAMVTTDCDGDGFEVGNDDERCWTTHPNRLPAIMNATKVTVEEGDVVEKTLWAEDPDHAKPARNLIECNRNLGFTIIVGREPDEDSQTQYVHQDDDGGLVTANPTLALAAVFDRPSLPCPAQDSLPAEATCTADALGHKVTVTWTVPRDAAPAGTSVAYTIPLQATDEWGGVDAKALHITVRDNAANALPVLEALASDALHASFASGRTLDYVYLGGHLGLTATFTDENRDPASTLACAADFGDGAKVAGTVAHLGGVDYACTAAHPGGYAEVSGDAGFTVTMQVRDAAGAEAATTLVVHVLARGGDDDHDSLTNEEELRGQARGIAFQPTDPYAADTDGDRYDDDKELFNLRADDRSDPSDINSTELDPDADGVFSAVEDGPLVGDLVPGAGGWARTPGPVWALVTYYDAAGKQIPQKDVLDAASGSSDTDLAGRIHSTCLLAGVEGALQEQCGPAPVDQVQQLTDVGSGLP